MVNLMSYHVECFAMTEFSRFLDESVHMSTSQTEHNVLLQGQSFH